MKDNEKLQEGGFVQLLSDHNKGRMLTMLDQHLAELVQEVQAIRKMGSIKLTVKIQPEGNDDAMFVSIEGKLDIPKAAPGKSLFFAGQDGTLSRTPQNQRNWIEEAEALANATEAIEESN